MERNRFVSARLGIIQTREPASNPSASNLVRYIGFLVEVFTFHLCNVASCAQLLPTWKSHSFIRIIHCSYKLSSFVFQLKIFIIYKYILLYKYLLKQLIFRIDLLRKGRNECSNFHFEEARREIFNGAVLTASFLFVPHRRKRCGNVADG